MPQLRARTPHLARTRARWARQPKAPANAINSVEDPPHPGAGLHRHHNHHKESRHQGERDQLDINLIRLIGRVRHQASRVGAGRVGSGRAGSGAPITHLPNRTFLEDVADADEEETAMPNPRKWNHPSPHLQEILMPDTPFRTIPLPEPLAANGYVPGGVVPAFQLESDVDDNGFGCTGSYATAGTAIFEIHIENVSVTVCRWLLAPGPHWRRPRMKYRARRRHLGFTRSGARR